MDPALNLPFISAIMIVYNGDNYISDAIDSVLNQSYTNFELLILNDGSTDNTENIILKKSTSDNRIIYLKNEKNKGLSYSRNKVIHHAKGAIIAVTDADDISLPRRFEKQLTYLMTHPTIHIIGSAVTLIDTHNKTHGNWSYPTTDAEIRNGLNNSCIVANPTCMFLKEVFYKIDGYNEALTICEDWDFFYRAAKFFHFKNEETSLIHYRIHDNNISKDKLEHTVVYSLYLIKKLPQESSKYTIKEFLIHFPEFQVEITQKAIQFYTFWINTYAVMGYKHMSRELFNIVKKDFFNIFTFRQKKQFIKNCLIINFKNKQTENTIPLLIHFLSPN